MRHKDTTPSTGGWVGPRGGLGAYVNRKLFCPWRESNPESCSPCSFKPALAKFQCAETHCYAAGRYRLWSLVPLLQLQHSAVAPSDCARHFLVDSSFMNERRSRKLAWKWENKNWSVSFRSYRQPKHALSLHVIFISKKTFENHGTVYWLLWHICVLTKGRWLCAKVQVILQ